MSIVDRPQEQTYKGGWKLPLVEAFYSIQGEGYHTGKAAYFIRIGGCDIGCHWCDSKVTWDARVHPLVPVEQIVTDVEQTPARSIVVTGGEPSLYRLDLLCRLLKEKGLTTYLETSGTGEFTGQWDWICLSPKKQSPPKEHFYARADELKVIIFGQDDFRWAEQAASRVNKGTSLYLQPEWSRYKQLIHPITEYVKEHPQWQVSLQAHKFMRIP